VTDVADGEGTTMPDPEPRDREAPASLLDAGRADDGDEAGADVRDAQGQGRPPVPPEHPSAPAAAPYDVPAPGDRVGGSLPGGGGGTAPGVQAGRAGGAGTPADQPVGPAPEQGDERAADDDAPAAPPQVTRPANAVPGRPEGEVDPRG
jgi:hypothetical protein